MQRTKAKLMELQGQTADPINVAIVAFLFCLILERVWKMLWCAANQKKLATFAKEHDKIPFWHLVTLQQEGAQYNPTTLPNLKTAAPGACKALKSAMAAWMPYHSKTGTMFYNAVGYWMHAFRFTRNITTHRTLQLVEIAPPVADGEPYDARPMLKLPINPAQDNYIDSNSGKAYPFAGVDKIKHITEVFGNGYIMMPAQDAVSEIVGVLFAIHEDLEKIVRACVVK